ncbi:fumarylacetoacetate hydrolase family protein [Curvibacter sp. HBC61]|uniref:Fumarylacetoacetate hydrolase family protein n=1 Tax=Curvibacter cyanobacteriorum TaxID=3026422 RepID=A0ABT5N5K4_9BURK|nr:fumarylacetoacetate hydrolase family protein [Curvibacter sp. HBC61]MDD0840367.1 fumarylacetoacetate hydrolase family protein [Curvibacter sp. HBC61]
MSAALPPGTAAPWQPAGTVYGVLLNFEHEHTLWRPRMLEAPYQAPPQAPVLYIKTANTWNPDGGQVTVPADAPGVEAGATLGLVRDAQGQWAAALLNDFSLPHDSYFRPPVKYRCRDGFLGTPAALRPLGSLAELATLSLSVHVNGELRQSVDLGRLRRDAATLWADVNDFMTLRPGDVLMLGCDVAADGGRPLLRPGDTVELSAPGFAPLRHHLSAEEARA